VQAGVVRSLSGDSAGGGGALLGGSCSKLVTLSSGHLSPGGKAGGRMATKGAAPRFISGVCACVCCVCVCVHACVHVCIRAFVLVCV